MSQDITATDLFCGAGGSTEGIQRAGVRVYMAANHWPRACETYGLNHPDARIDCADVSQVNPRRYPRTDILIASPECTNHSKAKARKVNGPTLWDAEPVGLDAAERSRATMWDVIRFAEHHKYPIVIVENVFEVATWAPFDAWLLAMRKLGYQHRIVSLNSFVAYPTPQSRDRMYVVFWRRGNRPPDLDIRAQSWCPTCERVVDAIQAWKNGRRFGRYRQQYVYACPTCGQQAIPFAYPAAAAIDWTLPTQRIGDRKKPLAEATMRRIRAGLERYGPAALVQAAGHTYERPGSGYYRTWPITLPMPTQTATNQHALVMDTAYSHREDRGYVRPIGEPLSTQTTLQSKALVVTLRGTAPDQIAGSARPIDDPLGTVSAGGIHHGLVQTALLMRNNGGGAEMVTPVDEVARTITTKGHQSLIALPFLVDYHGDGRPWQARGVDRPMGTVETKDRRALVDPAVDIEDCGFRMLAPHEIGRAMAFPESYEVTGNQSEKVCQYGNAVTPPAMDVIGQRCVDSLTPASEVANG